jgi:transcriptional regulator with XRE-family HTH domain
MRQALLRAGEEHRLARVGAGLSLRACADATGASYQQLSRFEHGQLRRLSLEDVGAWFAVVGLDLVLRPYPAGDPIRDRAQLALLERLRARLHPNLRWRTEVPLPIEGDLRAWDAEIRGREPGPWRARVEAETRIADGQALERKLALKLRDDPDGHLILLVSDSRSNRRALNALGPALRAMLPLAGRPILSALGVGRGPAGNGIVII